MSTAQVIGGRAGPPGEPAETAQTRFKLAISLPVATAGALLLLTLYAAFDHGAVALTVNARLEVAVAAIAAVAGAGWMWSARLRMAAPRAGVVGAALLAAFACWSGVTVLWSVAPDQTWIELNRAITYVLVLCLAIAVGATYAHAVALVANGFLAIALAVTAYAIGQKLLPGLHLSGVFNLDQTGTLPRLQEPLGYWNALALFVAMGVAVALAHAADPRRGPRTRLGAACAIEVMVVTIGLTYSRGGLLAVALALAVCVWVGGERLRSLAWAGMAVLAATPPLAYGLGSHSLTTAGVSLSSRESAGGVLALVLAISLGALVMAGRGLLTLDRRMTIGPGRAHRLRRLGSAAAVAVVLGGLLAMAMSSRGLTGTISHAWGSFTATRPASNTNPSRLLSADSENRWVWWKEAARAFGDRPVGGWGAGSFGVVHLLYRRDTLPVQQPHSVPLQFLAETGIVGALLAVGGSLLLVRAAASGARRRPSGSARLLAGALLGSAVAYFVHSLYDWDWNIPAVTLPALVFIGVLVGAGADRARSRPAQVSGTASKLLAVGALTVWLCAFALSAALPSLAASEANAALVEASTSSPGALQSAQSIASLASSLDPLSDAGLRAQATIAIHRGRLAAARTYLIQAVARDPTDGQAWGQLATLYRALGDSRDARIAALRVIALDPRGRR